MSHIILFHVINFAKTKQNRKNKQTNRKNVGGDTATAVRGQLQRARILIKRKKKKKFLKNTAIQEKLQVIGRDKGRALLHFKQIELNERGSLQS